jgi:hypothetical protein
MGGGVMAGPTTAQDEFDAKLQAQHAEEHTQAEPVSAAVVSAGGKPVVTLRKFQAGRRLEFSIQVGDAPESPRLAWAQLEELARLLAAMLGATIERREV